MRARLLLGWHDRDTAVRGLTTACIHEAPMTDDEAEALWRPYRDRVERLADRPRELPEEYELSRAERRDASAFLRGAVKIDHAVERVIKVDPMLMSVHQLVVVDEICDGYRDRLRTVAGWRAECLSAAPVPRRTLPARRQGAELVVDLPHGEFHTQPKVGGGGFEIREFPKWVTAVKCDGRLLLWSGYHRTFARISQMDPAPELTVERAVPLVLISKLAGASNTARVTVATGLRPPLFRDFLDPDLFFMVNLRRTLYQFKFIEHGNQITTTTFPEQRFE